MGAGGVVGHAKVGANPCKCISVTDALLGRVEMEGRKKGWPTLPIPILGVVALQTMNHNLNLMSTITGTYQIAA